MPTFIDKLFSLYIQNLPKKKIFLKLPGLFQNLTDICSPESFEWEQHVFDSSGQGNIPSGAVTLVPNVNE